MKVLIVDDHWMIRSSLRRAFETIDPTLETVDAATVKAATEVLAVHPDVDLIFIDLVMPGVSDLDGLKSLRRRYPEIPITVISVHEDREHVVQAIAEGAVGYIPKSAEGAELLRALTLVLNGGVYFPRDILQGTRMERDFSASIKQDPPAPSATSQGLTAREEQILELVLRGASNGEIAEQFGLSPNTVRVHVRNLGMKLNLRDREEIAAFRAAQQAATRRSS